MNKELHFKKKCLFFLQKALILSVIILSTIPTHANSLLQNNVTIKVINAQIEDILFDIQKQTGLNFLYNKNELSSLRLITISETNVSVETVLNKIFIGSHFTYAIDTNKILIKKIESINKKDIITIEGKVIDSNKKPIIGATLIVLNSQQGVITDSHGAFKIVVEDGSKLEITFIGMKTSTIIANKAIEKMGDKYIITLQYDNIALDEVIITGYGQIRKKELTGSVTTLRENDIEKSAPSSTLQSLLQGRSAGVSVQISSSSPTAPTSVIIRGQSSLSGSNQPLWVIDGVPEITSSTSGSVSNTLMNIGMNNIASINILRDAASTAIYGSRGANGVIVVTTKGGRRNMKPEITFSASVGVQKDSYNDLDFFDTDQYINFTRSAVAHAIDTQGALNFFTKQYADQAYFNSFRTSEVDRQLYRDAENVFYNGSTDWQNEIGQTPLDQFYDVSVRGGSENSSYFISLNYRDYNGVVKTGFSDTFGGTINFETEITKNVKFGINVTGSTRNTNARDDLMGDVRTIRPDFPAYNEDGSFFTGDTYTSNPLFRLQELNSGINRLAKITPFVTVNIIDGLSATVKPTINYSESVFLGFKPKVVYDDGSNDKNNSRTWSRSTTNYILLEGSLNYSKIIKKHNINVGLYYTQEKTVSDYYAMSAEQFPDDEVLNSFSNAVKDGPLYEKKEHNALMAMFGNVQYTYNEKYNFSASIRRDGSSRFGPESRWGIFPSVGLGWIMSDESFLKDIEAISHFKIRGSFGVTGSQNLGDHGFYAQTGGNTYNGATGIYPSAMANPNLAWEESVQLDLGFDFGFFDSRLNGEFSFFNKDTKSLIYNIPTPLSSSYLDIKGNIGATQNRGIELTVNYDIIRNKDHHFTLGFNITHSVNKVVKFNDQIDELWNNGVTSPNWASYIKMQPGQKMNQWYTYQVNRIFETAEELHILEREDETGNKIYYGYEGNNKTGPGDWFMQDTNGDGKMNYDDFVHQGSADPIAYGGISLDYTWKNFQISTLFTYAFGHKRNWGLMGSYFQAGNYNNINKIGGQSYSFIGPGAAMPSVTPYDYAGNGLTSSASLFDASYLRLNNIVVQ